MVLSTASSEQSSTSTSESESESSFPMPSLPPSVKLKILCLHGGLGGSVRTLQQLKELPRPFVIEPEAQPDHAGFAAAELIQQHEQIVVQRFAGEPLLGGGHAVFEQVAQFGVHVTANAGVE